MANETISALTSPTEKTLRILKQYLPYALIIYLAWANEKKDLRLETLRQENNQQQQSALDFARESYIKSMEAYQLSIRTYEQDHQNMDAR